MGKTALWRRTTLREFGKLLQYITEFQSRDLIELSEFFIENQPNVDYGKDYKKIFRTLGQDESADIQKCKLNEDNSFIFYYNCECDIDTRPVSRKIFLVTKLQDDYFLILERSYDAINTSFIDMSVPNFVGKKKPIFLRSISSHLGLSNLTANAYICDNIDGLREYLQFNFSKIKFDTHHNVYKSI
jgi:hypothetical protein